MNGADLLCETLLANDVNLCFANPGTSEMHFVGALDRRPEMRCVLGLSETVVTGAADGYARMAGKPAATLLHLGPGLANGLANLHNAKRAATPVLNVVGDHASYHLAYDAPLTSDIESLARPVSGWVGRAESPDRIAIRTAEALTATRRGAEGQVSTLILPADSAWGAVSGGIGPVRCVPTVAAAPSQLAIEAACAALRGPEPALIILGGDALRAKHMELASIISQGTGATILTENASRRIERGSGRVGLARVPYPVDAAVATLSRFKTVILIGAIEPIAFFAYPGKPSRLLPEGCVIVQAATPAEDAYLALQLIADSVGPVGARPQPILSAFELPESPRGRITAETLGAAVARDMPEAAIVCNEAITGGEPFSRHSMRARPHDMLGLVGGAIGCGIPLATGAALACPDRKVINLQADGSGLYSLQGLWTQAREQLDVVTVILANRRYAILRAELANVGAGAPGVNASRMLNMTEPAPDWVHLAKGMGVDAVAVDSAEALSDVFAAATKRRGPFLIEAIMD